MKNKSFIACGMAFVLLISGCVANLSEIQKGFYLTKDQKFEEDKLVYSKEQRCYKYKDKVLLNETGEKVKTKEETLERANSLSTFEKTTTGGVVFTFISFIGLTLKMVLMPVETILTGVLYIPLAPYVFYEDNKNKKGVFKNYRQGDILLLEGQYKEAREHYIKALLFAPNLVQTSDIYYKMAKTYEGNGDKTQAKDYYQKFLNYSLGQYPGFFEKFDKLYKNDLSELDKKFSEAEEKL